MGLEKRFTDLHPAGDGRIPREQCQMLEFVHIIFKVFTLSMRFEPSNAKYFSTEVETFLQNEIVKCEKKLEKLINIVPI